MRRATVTLPVDDFLDRPAPRTETLLPLLLHRLGRGMADRYDADDLEVAGDSELLAEQVVVLGRVETEEPGAETLVDRRQQKQHHRFAGVHPPPRDTPLDLFPVLELVGSV